MRSSSLSTLAVILVFGCGDQPTMPAASEEAAPVAELTMNSSVVHQASLGGADFCEAFGFPTGCDANFSLVANQRADGTVTGQWQDAFAGGGEGIHVAIDCLNVVGNGAVIGGVITNGQVFGVDVSGQAAVTAVVDNGTSVNDPADQMSFSFFPVGVLCTQLTPADFPLFDLTNGQVAVR